MVTTASPTLLDASPGELVLRVCGTARDGQFVRLTSAKCSIGSGPRCTLRLAARGVGPLHCLILRGEGGTVVRRWSADTRLNGRAFSDAVIAPGDRLSVGPIELEVVQTGSSGSRLEEEHRVDAVSDNRTVRADFEQVAADLEARRRQFARPHQGEPRRLVRHRYRRGRPATPRDLAGHSILRIRRPTGQEGLGIDHQGLIRSGSLSKDSTLRNRKEAARCERDPPTCGDDSPRKSP